MAWHHRTLERFTVWFGSGGGVWQTLAVTTALLPALNHAPGVTRPAPFVAVVRAY